MSYHKRGKLIHGYSARKHPLYSTWAGMKDRCYNPNNKAFENYGERGIKVCKRWKKSFENFALDMGLKPNRELSIERMNNNGNYKPSNCKWGTMEEQGANKRTYKTSKTGHSGIRVSQSGTYQVRTLGSPRKILGCFPTLDEALVAQKTGAVNLSPRSSNTTGLKGVTYNHGMYQVRKTVNGERLYLGACKTLDGAKTLYDSGVKQSKREGTRDAKTGRYRK